VFEVVILGAHHNSYLTSRPGKVRDGDLTISDRRSPGRFNVDFVANHQRSATEARHRVRGGMI
jgi:hypothetical protein